uniref:Uncharacterized protein n=1 Tax=Bionectria ochroleuca TaxID=29856 RepID=A0A8H7NLT8_BIOOC
MMPAGHAAAASLRAPFVKSRPMPFKSPLHRFFPEVATWPSQGPMPWPEYTGIHCETMRPLVRRRERPSLQFSLRLIRCPECHTWQEQRAFRLIEAEMLYDPPTEEYDIAILKKTGREIGVRQLLALDEDVLCNHCFYKEHGAEDLEDELVETFRTVVTNEIRQVRHTVYEDWQNYLLFAEDESEEMVDLIYAHADPEVPRAYKLCEDEPRMTKDELEAVTARRFYKFAVAASEIMQSERWVPLVGVRYFVWAAQSRHFIERWIHLEDVLARLDAGTDSLSEWALARQGPCLA